MPGMMDTVLNLGLNDEVVTGLAAKSGERFAYDSYRRFLDMFGDVVSILVIFQLLYQFPSLSTFLNFLKMKTNAFYGLFVDFYLLWF